MKMVKGNFTDTPRGFFHYHKSGSSGDTILFCHGNSLSAGTYLPFLADIADRGFTVFAGDLRGHGYSTKERTRTMNGWQIFIKDLAAFVSSVADPPVIGMGHSIGGYFTYAAAALYPRLFSKLVLLDPIILPSEIVWGAAVIRKLGLAGYLALPKRTRSKKYEFESKQEALDHYMGKGMFAPWQAQFVKAYVDTAIEQDTTNTYALCCQPELEARIYECVPVDTWTHASKIKVPVQVIRGEHSTFFSSRAAKKLLKKLPDCRFEELPGLGHFFMMENPQLAVDRLVPFLAGQDGKWNSFRKAGRYG